MPYRPVPTRMTDASGRPITHYEEVLDEPTAPATESPGASVALTYTPRGHTNERYLAGVAAGPGDARLDLSTNGGGAWSDASAGIAVGTTGVAQSILIRGVGLPVSGNSSEVTTLSIGVAYSGEAGWLA